VLLRPGAIASEAATGGDPAQIVNGTVPKTGTAMLPEVEKFPVADGGQPPLPDVHAVLGRAYGHGPHDDHPVSPRRAEGGRGRADKQLHAPGLATVAARDQHSTPTLIDLAVDTTIIPGIVDPNGSPPV
jgi:hypothetical protein